MSNREQGKTDILQGTLDIMVLQTLTTLGPLHGYAIAARLEQVSNGAIHLNMGTLYPGLMRLEQRGLVRGKWGVTENNRKARFYAISAACSGSKTWCAISATRVACSQRVPALQSSRLSLWRLASVQTARSSVLRTRSFFGLWRCRAPATCSRSD